MILITGCEGVIGSALSRALRARGRALSGLDIRASTPHHGNVTDRQVVFDAVSGCSGVIHLAAVSRVVWGEENPELCSATNTGGTRHVIAAALAATPQPWVIFASSREVYGHPDQLPVTEDCPIRPINTYGRSKAAGERMMEAASRQGLRAAIARLSNVYGAVDDHADRVVPAFVIAAASGGTLRVDGSQHSFDFTHLDDTVRGLVSLVDLLDRSTNGQSPPPLHFVTGRATTLGELAAMAVAMGDSGATVVEAPPRPYDVSRFRGDFERAQRVLDWKPRVPLQEGLQRLMAAHRAAATAS